jgi:D-galactose 1-dehydrogenase
MRLPCDAALIVVDVQKAIDDPRFGPRNNLDAERAVAALLAAWRDEGLPIVHVRHDSVEPDSPYRPERPGHAFKPEAEPREGETVIAKSAPSAFVGTRLEEALDALGATTLVLCGALTHNSVEATARHAGDLGYRVFVVADACWAVDLNGRDGRRWPAELVHALSLAALDREWAEIVDCATALAAARLAKARARRQAARAPKRASRSLTQTCDATAGAPLAIERPVVAISPGGRTGGSELGAYSIALIGVGKVASDHHLPVILKSRRFRLACLVGPQPPRSYGVPHFGAPAEAYAALPEIDAVVLCTPPAARHALALEALAAGKHVLLEKPPATTMAELRDLTTRFAEGGRVVFAAWHSQYNAAVEIAKARLAGAKLRRLAVDWRENVRRFHPRHQWIWDAGNFGVFDAGVNALSILTKIVPEAIFVKSAELFYPSNRDAPIAASLVFASPAAADDHARLSARFDWRHEGEHLWNIDVETAAGERLALRRGGAELSIDGVLACEAERREYEQIYEHFAALLDAGRGAADPAPFQLVADAFMVGSRRVVEPFEW